MIDTILFDLDGTLLWMDLDEFTNEYFGLIEERFRDYNKDIIKATYIGVKSMLANDGVKSNQEVFWDAFGKVVPIDDEIIYRFDKLYEEDFPKLQKFTKFNPLAEKAITLLQEKGYTIAICTNPLYPSVATRMRLKWAGLSLNEFSIVTTYENSSFSKPNPKYYQEVLSKLNKAPEQCIMVGNDVIEDLSIREIGVKTFIVDDNLININNCEYVSEYRGKFKDFYDFVVNLPYII